MHDEWNEKSVTKTPTDALTVKAAAEELGVSPSLVYGLCAAGKIRHERHGLGRGTIRIARAALAEYRRDAAGAVRRPDVTLKHITLR